MIVGSGGDDVIIKYGTLHTLLLQEKVCQNKATVFKKITKEQ
jgi:hypothetical protein